MPRITTGKGYHKNKQVSVFSNDQDMGTWQIKTYPDYLNPSLVQNKWRKMFGSGGSFWFYE